MRLHPRTGETATAPARAPKPARVAAIAFLCSACAGGAALRTTPAPDVGKRAAGERGMVSTANPLASEAGLAMLQAGGNAVDAAVAAAFAIGVVEPQMSGLGGSGSMLVWDARMRRAEYADFYAAQHAPSFRDVADAARAPGDLRIVGIPGNVAGLLEAHERFGRLTRAQVIAPAIALAEQGFPINQVLAETIVADSAKLFRFEASHTLLWPGGEPLPPGARLRNPALADVLNRIAREGRAGFYEGDVAADIVRVLNAGRHPASLADLREYTVQWKRPMCGDYRGRVVLSAPPPQTGSHILHVLEMLEPIDLAALGLPTRDARAFDALASALRVGIADHRANDDPDWVPVPAAGIASPAFARARASLVAAGAVPPVIEMADATAFDGESPAPACVRHEPYGPTPPIPGVSGGSTGAGATSEDEDGGETTHISVVDADGNAVALTQTNSTTFGSGASVRGFFLNDSGFLFTSRTATQPSRGPWRTRTSTIAPTIVLENDRVAMVIGAPGGGRIPPTILQVMVYALDYGMDPLDAVRMPRMFPGPGSPAVQLETGFAADVLEQVRRMGWAPAPQGGGYARIYMIVRRDGRWIGVADPRHNGEVRGW